MPSQEDFAIAFSLTTGAGLATSLGAALVFLPQMYNAKVLGCCLAFAAGVMIYVSFVEIFFKGLDEYEVHFDDLNNVNRSAISAEDYEPNTDAYHATTATFFVGIIITWLLDLFIHRVYSYFGHVPHGHGHLEHQELEMFSETRDHIHGPEFPEEKDVESGKRSTEEDITQKTKEMLIMALITGTAIALHNFPEGLATFVATAKDTSVGVPLAIAIGVHNIPEGIAVAIPIYFSTKSKCKAFWLATASGLAEPIAGGIGWIILGQNDGDVSSLVYAILFGLVAGMMCYISFRELLPTARRYDPDDVLVTKTVFLGMLVMAASLMLFQT
eukprot:m.267017 g.267017  ORF g.267017 m.267017 type:complete len:328 (-) comp31977_c0_seq1:84-1067(-)